MGRVPEIVFDDGPSEYTNQILDVLAAHGERAIFCVVGQHIEGREAELRRIVAEEHKLGNHTWSHRPVVDLTAEEVWNELQDTKLACYQACGRVPSIYRSPFVRYDQRVFDVVLGLHFRRVLVESGVGDYAMPDEEALVAACVAARDRGLLTIGLHELPMTTRALPAIIQAIRA